MDDIPGGGARKKCRSEHPAESITIEHKPRVSHPRFCETISLVTNGSIPVLRVLHSYYVLFFFRSASLLPALTHHVASCLLNNQSPSFCHDSPGLEAS